MMLKFLSCLSGSAVLSVSLTIGAIAAPTIVHTDVGLVLGVGYNFTVF